jgi:uncharacterized repeat protein (TIGR01451 family)
MTIRTFLLLILLIPLCGPVFAQQPPPPLPRSGPAPLLFVRFRGPQAMQATFFQGNPQGHSFDAPVTVGLRPGYSYRLRLSNLPKHADAALYPTVQVCGVPNLPPNAAVDAYPVNVVLSDDDIEQAFSGSLITKVFYIESTDKAVPQTIGRDQLLEYDVGANRNPLTEALSLGRPVLVVCFGEKQLTPVEAAQQNVPGTILQPGDKGLSPPALPPCVPCLTTLFDPILGARSLDNECLHGGGGARAGIGADGKLHGLDPEDTVAEYTDAKGQRSVVHSNRVSLCVPRFGVVRHVLPLGRYDTVTHIDDTRGVRGQEQMQMKLPSLSAQQYEQLQAMQARERPSATSATQGLVRLSKVEMLNAADVDLGLAGYLGTQFVQKLGEVDRARLFRQVNLARELSLRETISGVEQITGTTVMGRVVGGPDVIKAAAETRDLTLSGEDAGPVVLPDRPLVLTKWADKQTAQAGDMVTFTLRYSNQGGKAITDVAVTDSLTTRLEYIPGSAQSDRNAVFTTQANQAGSTIVRWEITGVLQPGQSGIVRFQARIR